MRLQRLPAIAHTEGSSWSSFPSRLADFRIGQSLLCSTALAGVLVILPFGIPVQAQTVTTDGDVATADPTTPVLPGPQPNPWNIGNTLIVGDTATGSMDIEGGGIVNSGQGGIIGNALSGRGTVTVDGAGSVWNTGLATHSLIVGNVGGGELNITGQGRVISEGMIVLGNGPDASGDIIVNGGGQLESSGILHVGQIGAGSLNILNGSVSGVGAVIGDTATSGGAVAVNGPSSVWSNLGEVYVGGSGSGILSVTAGGRVLSVAGSIGDAATSVSIATVSGAGSSWTNSGSLDVGYEGSGTLHIEDGAIVSNANGYVGNQLGSTGAVTVHGSGSLWENTGAELAIGMAGTGTLDIADGGEVRSSGVGLIGFSDTGDGTVTVRDFGSMWRHNGNLGVGLQGVGRLTISNGGLVENNAGYIADGIGSTGEVTVRDAGSAWINTSDLYVANHLGATGTLNITDSGYVSNANNGHIGFNNGSVGVVNVERSGFGRSVTISMLAPMAAGAR